MKSPTADVPDGVKSILVTGASRGIGRAVALECGARGWSVAVHYLHDAEAARETAALVTAAGGSATTVRGDVALEEDVIRLFDTARDRLGPLDGVVINAGILAPALCLADMPAERLRKVFDVNVYGAYLCAREAARRLPATRGGRGGAVVLVSSAASRIGSPFEFVDYAGSKAALDTLCLGLAKELGGQGVRVNAVRPGIIDTGIHFQTGQADRVQRLGGASPLGRAGRAEEVAQAIVWLLSDAASYTSGALLDVAGGR